MKPRRVTATLEFESTLPISDIKENIFSLFEIYDENKVLKIIQIQLNVIKKEKRIEELNPYDSFNTRKRR